MSLSPLEFLALMLTITAGAAAVQLVARQRRIAQLRALAAEKNLHFSAADRFHLAPRVAPRLPSPGAAAVRVSDVIYGVDRESYRYLFSVEYTVGVLRRKDGIRRVATFAEPRDASAGAASEPTLEFAPQNLPLIEQYRRLLRPAEAVAAEAPVSQADSNAV